MSLTLLPQFAQNLVFLAAIDDVSLLAVGAGGAKSFARELGTDGRVGADSDVRIRTFGPVAIATQEKRTDGNLLGRHFVRERTSGEGARAAQETRANRDARRIVRVRTRVDLCAFAESSKEEAMLFIGSILLLRRIISG